MTSDPKENSTLKTRTPRKVRDIETINSDVIDIARKFFAEKNFDQVRLEDIATKAGTSVAHIMRSFETKDGLFQAAIDQQFKLWDMLKSDREHLGEFLSKYVTATIEDEAQIQHVMLFIKGSLHPRSRKALSEKFEAQFTEPCAKWLGGTDAKHRAGVMAAFLFGLTFHFHLSESEPFRDEDREKLQKIAAPLIQSLIDGK